MKLVRHGESEANIGLVSAHEVGDPGIPLSERGREQARAVGRHIGRGFIEGALVYSSPYQRTRDTLLEIHEAVGIAPLSLRSGRYEDPRLREVEHGYEPVETQEELRKRHGWFYYRFRGGESPADCYDRTSAFLESLMRQIERKKSDRVLIVTHGLTIRCFVMRFMHLSVEEFDSLANPHNCDVITISENGDLADAQFTSGRWAVSGLRLRPPEDG
ncbi:MAG: histidine phosphatase family protein [Labilithrix sp.]|nr:histidine phosphatase family protein [Labilithrix sp.]MCW5818018.1 histidine phosphatase family protein [Labilithrix sp.]